MPTLQTWGGRSRFSYTGSVKTGTKIAYGSGYPIPVTADEYAKLLEHFRGRTVNIGTSRTAAPEGSVGKWLQCHVTQTAVASYVGPILIAEGYAEKGERAEIRFRQKAESHN